jgi:mRNA interferase RelE/StbE
LEAVLVDWQYIVLKPAQKYLERMQPDEQLRIIEALDGLVVNSENFDIKPLQGRPESRLRVGKYRILFVKDEENQIYVVTTIGSRGDVYK